MKYERRLPVASYVARTNDEHLLMSSASGGVFTELAKVVLRNGGVVFGVTWDSRFRAVHKWVDNEAELEALRGSKYVFSEMSGVYCPLRKFLLEGRLVLFSGTPCQTAAIRKVFGNDPNLILCSLFCMANVDSRLWSDYLNKLEHKVRSRVVGVRHRMKREGVSGTFVAIDFEDADKNILQPFHDSEWWKIFARNPRKVCCRCKFRGGHNGADLQIGDCWGLKECYPELEDGRGWSEVLVYSDVGAQSLAETDLIMKSLTYEQALVGNPYLNKQYVPLIPAPLLQRAGRKLMRCILKAKRSCFSCIK